MKIDKKHWIVQGLLFGLFMFIFMTAFDTLVLNEPASIDKLLLTLPVWILGGLIYGLLLKYTNSLPK